ncbi:MAG: peptidoglycan DD-metalloendopeptidase family protein [Parcubacteria group bacterium]|nr:peptidoglycan DD-metalloendopeptidase family protein [Parcubacteria group bacterium]
MAFFVPLSAEADYNSQNLPLLEANISSISVLQGGNGLTNPSINIVSDNAMLPLVGPMGVSDGTDVLLDSSGMETSVYVVRKGDSLSAIAEMFGVSTNTILWANDLKKGEPLKEGEVLLILPISGVKHVVQKGETLKGLAQKYKAEVLDIAAFNGISVNATLSVGDELIIPNGELIIDGPVNTNPKVQKTPLKDATGYFINPAPGAIKTQGLHGRNAVDLAAPIGTPIRAAASGKVLVARMGWNGGYGGLVIIQHPNGTQTLYAHLSGLNTTAGENVSQGEIIAYMGNSGHVRASKGGNGSHLHFEIHGAKNPF